MKKVSLEFLKSISGYAEHRRRDNKPSMSISLNTPSQRLVITSKQKFVLGTTKDDMFRSEPILLLLEHSLYSDMIGCAWVIYLVLNEGGYYLWEIYPNLDYLNSSWDISYELRRVLIEKTSIYK